MLRRLSALILRSLGWQPVFVAPPCPKSVVLVYPHTSNWDFPLGMLFRFCCGIRFHWAGKDSLFHGPVGGVFVRLGGIPINRREPNGTIARLTEAFAAHETIHLCIAPEGTRARVEHWKSGFYHLARSVGVPVGLGFIDYRRKRVGVECWIELTGDKARDMARIRAYYVGISALRAENASPVRLKEP